MSDFSAMLMHSLRLLEEAMHNRGQAFLKQAVRTSLKMKQFGINVCEINVWTTC